MRPEDLVLTEETRRGFYPTPPALAEKMLSRIDWRYIQHVLEPSAGKGDLVKAFREVACTHMENKLFMVRL